MTRTCPSPGAAASGPETAIAAPTSQNTGQINRLVFIQSRNDTTVLSNVPSAITRRVINRGFGRTMVRLHGMPHSDMASVDRHSRRSFAGALHDTPFVGLCGSDGGS
jgi:hypothetical protein